MGQSYLRLSDFRSSGSWLELIASSNKTYYLFKIWLRIISFGKFMTILDFWYFTAKSSKNFNGGKENVSAIAIESIKDTKTLIFQAMSSSSSWIWTIDNKHIVLKKTAICIFLWPFKMHLYINGIMSKTSMCLKIPLNLFEMSNQVLKIGNLIQIWIVYAFWKFISNMSPVDWCNVCLFNLITW